MVSHSSDMMYLSAALLSAGIGSVYDVRAARIPNALTGPSVLLGMMLHLACGGWSDLAHALLAGVIGGGVFLVFFLVGGMGAGDVKLMAAVGCLAGLGSLSTIMIATVLVGGVLALLIAASRGRFRETLANVSSLASHCQERGLERHEELNLANAHTLRMPYAVPIAAGCLIALSTLVTGGR
jgi:prepilin peptidase CpaA